MFDKFNVNELYIGIVEFRYPQSVAGEFSAFDWAYKDFDMTDDTYPYCTILRKLSEDSCVDLQNMQLIGTVRTPQKPCYIIHYIEPLSNYYNQDGTKKDILSRKQALKEANKHFSTVYQNSGLTEKVDNIDEVYEEFVKQLNRI